MLFPYDLTNPLGYIEKSLILRTPLRYWLTTRRQALQFAER